MSCRSADITEFMEAPLVLPFWSGERCTGWKHDSRGTITGLTHDTSPRQLLASLLDGVMVRLHEIVLLLDDVLRGDGGGGRQEGAAYSPPSCVEAIVGSGAVLEKGWVWRQMLADITNLPVLVLKEKNGETTLNGLAVHILEDQQQCTTAATDFVRPACTGRNSLLFGFDKDDVEEINFPIEINHHLYRERFLKMKQLYNNFHEN
jgi:sugar (pentulose or hexulose) kinase